MKKILRFNLCILWLILMMSRAPSLKAQFKIADSVKEQIKQLSFVKSRIDGSKIFLCYNTECDSNECSENRVCSRCCFLKADSIMSEEINTILSTYARAKKDTLPFLSDQDKWIKKRNKMAYKKSEEFKGASFEMIAFSLALTDETRKRTKYLKSLEKAK